MSHCKTVLAITTLLGACATAASPPAHHSGELPGVALTLNAGEARLAASLLMPETAPHAGVVMLAGSGPARRGQLVAAAGRLVAAGNAVLIFDKRGSGESGGDWRTASLDDLAADAIAALRALREHAGVNRAGFWAHSQGNWVATRALELGADPAFIVAVAGGGAAPRVVERHNYSQRVAAFGAAERQRALALVDNYFDYLGGDLSRSELDERIAPVASTPWYEALGLARVLVSEAGRGHWDWVARYDPGLVAAVRDVPTLVVLGGDDGDTPLEMTVTSWAAQLGAEPSRIVVLPGRDHHLQRGGGAHGIATDLELWSLIGDWIAPGLDPR